MNLTVSVFWCVLTEACFQCSGELLDGMESMGLDGPDSQHRSKDWSPHSPRNQHWAGVQEDQNRVGKSSTGIFRPRSTVDWRDAGRALPGLQDEVCGPRVRALLCSLPASPRYGRRLPLPYALFVPHPPSPFAVIGLGFFVFFFLFSFLLWQPHCIAPTGGIFRPRSTVDHRLHPAVPAARENLTRISRESCPKYMWLSSFCLLAWSKCYRCID